MWLFYCFNLERNFDVLKLLTKYINFDKSEMELKMENSTRNFGETKFVLQLIQESQIKRKTLMRWSSWKKKGSIFLHHLFCPKEIFLAFVFYLNIYVLSKLSEDIQFYISKRVFHCMESVQIRSYFWFVFSRI